MRKNTLLIFIGDNGTGKGTKSMMGDRVVIGGKGSTTAAGMHVPCIVSWPAVITTGRVCSDLIDSTDFLPTICDAAGVKLPAGLTVDGRSVLPQLHGEKGNPRDWIYSWYSPRGEPLREFAFDQRFKLYRSGEFFDLTKDRDEKTALSVTALTGESAIAAQRLQTALRGFDNARPNKLPRPQGSDSPADKSGKKAKKKAGKKTNPNAAATDGKPRINSLPHQAQNASETFSLFNGESLAGWTTQDGQPITNGWIVEDGAICRANRGGNIFYEREVGDFELSFDWKIVAGGNSGLKYRVRKYGSKELGCEYQLLGEKGISFSKNSTGALYDLYEPNDQKHLNPIGEWNSAKVIVHGPKIEHWLNGEKVVEADLTSEDWQQRLAKSKFAPHDDFARNTLGRIMLTDHGSKAWFRNLVLRPLPSAAIPPPEKAE